MWKRNISLLIAAVGMFAAAVQAQPGILQPTSGPGGGPMRDLAYATDGDVFVFADELYRSHDCGWSWQIVPRAPGTSRLAAGWAGEVWSWGFGGLYRTTDDGTTWTRLPQAPSGIYDLVIDISQRAFAATVQGLFVSVDGGATWTQASIPAVSIGAIATTPSGAILVGDREELYRSADGGETWERIAVLGNYITALAERPQGGYYAGVAPNFGGSPAGGMFRVDTDGDALAAGLVSEYVSHILVRPDGLVFVGCSGISDGLHVYAAGIFRSTDGGATWTVTGCYGDPTALVAGADDSIWVSMWTSGSDTGEFPTCGVLYTNGPGTQWILRNRGLGGATIYDLAASPGGVVYAAADLTIASTADDGTSWNEVEGQLAETLDYQRMWDLEVHPDGTLFALHPLGTLWRSPDRGRTWTALALSGINAPSRLAVTPAGAILVGTAGGEIWRSEDRVASWTRVHNGSSEIRDIVTGPLGRVAASTWSEILLGEDNATSWSVIAAATGRPAFSPDEQALYLATGSEMLRFVDQGGSWRRESMPSVPVPEEVVVDADGRVYAANRTTVYWTSPGNTGWTSLGGTACSGFYMDQQPRLVFASDGYLYFGTSCDGVYRSATPLREPTGTDEQDGVLLARWSAPNPFRDATTIAFTLARTVRVHAAVYDVRGRLVATLADGRSFAPGPHELNWTPPPGTPNGVFAYHLRAGEIARSGRIALLR